jgi:hypothetical protein
MKRIYGGIIGAPEKAITPFPSVPPFVMQSNSLLLANGRSAIDVVVQQLQPRKIWLPSYLCKTMMTKQVMNRLNGIYNVDRYLEIDSSFLNSVQNNDLVILINYFGFRWPEEVGSAIQSRGAWVLEDSSMGLFTEPSPMSHYVIRNLGLTDGAILTSQCFIELNEVVGQPPQEWLTASKKAREGRQQFDAGLIDHKEWLKDAARAKKLCPSGAYVMSDESEVKLVSFYNYDKMRERQRRNYMLMQKLFKNHCVLATDNSGWTDYPGGYFPIICMERDSLQKKLFADGIFPAIHWRLPWLHGEYSESQWLASKLLSIPCDWRYDDEEITHIAKRVNFHLGVA